MTSFENFIERLTGSQILEIYTEYCDPDIGLVAPGIGEMIDDLESYYHDEGGQDWIAELAEVYLGE